jgi:hypothetical protein
MDPEGHEKKANRIEGSLTKLKDQADYEMIIESCYAASIQYIALICDRRRKKHLDTHKGLAGFLDENDLPELSSPFRELELLRTSKYYGGQGNGKSAKEAKRILADIKSKLH